MIKKLIFDLDNTIMIWYPNYIKALEKVAKKYDVFNYTSVIDNIIETLEHKYNKISKEILLKEINDTCNLNLSIDFINDLFIEQSKLTKLEDDVIDTLSYLNSKYELVILSNYFKEVQINRLKNANILKYFTNVYGGEEIVKPNKEAFIRAIGNDSFSSCVVIGDGKADIEGAKNLNLKLIVIDYFNKRNDEDLCIIRKFSDLKNIL